MTTSGPAEHASARVDVTTVSSVAGSTTTIPTNPERPRLGFLGVGWIGRQRMQVIGESGAADVVAICDPSPEMRAAALETSPEAGVADSFDDLLRQELDGLVIATPSALHAEQSIAALEAGLAVFCQKPLGRNRAEVDAVIRAAERADRLLGVDLSYRYAAAFERVREVIRSGELGRVYAADLVFHNAYGPDKSWFFDPALAGGGCVMDLGVHLVDTALWALDFPQVDEVSSRLFRKGMPLAPSGEVEDYAVARLDLETGATAHIACSWNLPAGRDAIISATFYGVDGGVAVHNVDGSFYDFVAERFRGTHRERLVGPPDPWSGRAGLEWARELAAGARFDPSASQFARVAEVLDRIYGRG